MNRLLLAFFAILVSSFIWLDKGFDYPNSWPKPVYDFSKNTLDSSKILLGRILFYDPILSADSTISCASCHSPYNAFAHVDHKLSHGINDRIGIRNAPALMNLAWQPVFMMDGAVNHLDVQALAPIANPDEMDSSIQDVVKKLKRNTLYINLFNQAYGSSKITGERTLKALTQFMLILRSKDAKYDQVKRGELAFTEQEVKGERLFEKYCATCHQPPLFTNFSFQRNGLPLDENLKDLGRQKITGKAKDSLFFKVPTLRNIAYSYPYMHDGRFKNLKEVVDHYASMTPEQLKNTSITESISLSVDERVELISFLLTLSDKKYLFNPNYTYPKKIIDSLRGIN